jgi:UDP-glucose 4-epimerase
MQSRVLLTGGGGFVGSQVAYQLSKRGDHVVVMDIKRPSGYSELLLRSAGPSLSFVEADLTDLSTLILTMREFAIDKIVHLAVFYSSIPTLEIKRNIEAGLNVMESARLAKINRLVNMSSQSVYGPAPEGATITEDRYIGPLTAYGCHKLSVECIGSIYERMYGVTCITLRPTAVYGSPGDNETRFFKIAVENAVKNIPVKFDSGGDQMRDFIHVKDVANAILLALDVDKSRLIHRTFNLAWGEPYPQKEFIRIVNDLAPRALAEIGPGPGPESDSGVRDYGSIICQKKSTERAEKELGWTPTYDLRRGIQDYIESWNSFLHHKPVT